MFFPIIFVPPAYDIRSDEGFIIVVFSWLLSSLIGALPYILYGGEFTFTNAWFESVSGFTTTGSTILNDIEALPLGLAFLALDNPLYRRHRHHYFHAGRGAFNQPGDYGPI